MLAVPTKIGPFLRSRLFSWPGKLRMGLDLVIPGRQRPRRRVDRVLPAPPLRPGVGRAPGRAAARRASTPATPSGSRSSRTFPRFRDLERSTAASCAACGRRRGRSARAGETARLGLLLAALRPARAGRRARAAPRPRARCVTKLPVRQVDRRRRRLPAAHRPPGDARGRARDRRRARAADRAGARGARAARPRAALAAIPFASSATVLLGYRREDVAHPLNGYGLVVPQTEGLRTTALSFVSTKFPLPRARGARAAARLPRRRARRRASSRLTDEEMVDTVTREMSRLLGLRGRPVMTRVFRWPGGTPQLEVGHLERMDAVERAARERGAGPAPRRRRHPQHGHPRLGGRGHARRRGRGGGAVSRAVARASRSCVARSRRPLPGADEPQPQTPRRVAGTAAGQPPSERRAARGQRAAAGPCAAGNHVAASVVYIQVYRSPFDWSLPWRQEPVSGASGSGFVIEGGRILTNAHVVADARQILVRRPDQANPYVATVETEGDDCDLAVLRVDDPAFLAGPAAAALGDLPRDGQPRPDLRLPARRPGRLLDRGHRLAHRVARLRALRRRLAPRGADRRGDQPRQQRRAGGAGRPGRGRRVPGLSRASRTWASSSRSRSSATSSRT